MNTQTIYQNITQTIKNQKIEENKKRQKYNLYFISIALIAISIIVYFEQLVSSNVLLFAYVILLVSITLISRKLPFGNSPEVSDQEVKEYARALLKQKEKEPTKITRKGFNEELEYLKLLV